MNNPYIKKCITIFIQGHGSIVRKSDGLDFINSGLRNNVSILDIPGGISRSGLMAAECPKMTIRGSKKRSISDVNLCGQAIDIMSMEYLHNLYRELSKKSNGTGCDVSKEGIEIIKENIPLIYGNADIPYFHSTDEVMSNPSEPYKLSNPHYNKLYSMYPNTHEYCDPQKGNCEMGQCKLLRKRLRTCPEYGITVIHSSIPSDLEYTLSGLPIVYDNDIEEENRLAINLNQDEGHKSLRIKQDDDDVDEYVDDYDEDGKETPKKHSSYTFWKLKLTRYKIQETREIQSHITYHQRKKQGYNGDIELIEEEDKKIRKLQDLLKKTEVVWQERITTYNTMTNVFERHIPRSTLTKEEERMLPRVTLSNLIDIFINGMKYDHIYIIDPTCNSCDFTGSRSSKLLKVAAHDILERVRTKTNRSSMIPIVYKKRYNNPSEGYNNPRESRKVLKRTKSIGGKRKKNITKKCRKRCKSYKK